MSCNWNFNNVKDEQLYVKRINKKISLNGKLYSIIYDDIILTQLLNQNIIHLIPSKILELSICYHKVTFNTVKIAIIRPYHLLIRLLE